MVGMDNRRLFHSNFNHLFYHQMQTKTSDGIHGHAICCFRPDYRNLTKYDYGRSRLRIANLRLARHDAITKRDDVAHDAVTAYVTTSNDTSQQLK